MRISGDPRRRPNWPVLLLLASLVATALAAFQAQRVVRSHQRTAERLIQDYAAITSWNYQRFASEALRSGVVAVLGPFMHFQLHGQLHIGGPPSADWFIDHYIDTNSPFYDAPPNTELPATFFAFAMGADTLGQRGEPIPDRLAALIVDTLNTHIRRVHEHAWAFGLVTATRAGGVTVAYTLMPMERGDTTIYGFVIDERSVSPLLRRVHETADLLPATLTGGRPNLEIVDVLVSDAHGGKLYGSALDILRGAPGEHLLPPQFGGLRVSTSVRSSLADQLIIGGLPRSRLPFLLGLLGIATALVLVSTSQLRREGQLARLRSDFVSSVSHELRTPLAQIRLFLDSLQLRTGATSEQRDWMLGNIDRETARLAGLVENLLLFSHLDHGRSCGEAVDVQLAQEIRQIARAFEPLAASRNVRLRVDATDDVVARVQPGPLRQVMLNLLDNAVKYGPAGQTVTIRLERAGASSHRNALARITVEDEGPGVPAGERARIWKPFERGSGASVGGVAGGGIGLSIVRDVVEQHGGSVTVGEAPGGGAAFVLELPALADTASSFSVASLGAATS